MQPMVKYHEEKRFPTLVAHRGASFYAPENTMPSFELAWKQGATLVEGDFWLTADDHIVCIHDPTTSRTAPGSPEIDVCNSRYEEFCGYDVGSWKAEHYNGTHIPLLEEILAEMPEGSGVYIEIKQDTDRIIDVLQEVIAKSHVDLSQITLISFNANIVQRAKKLVPAMRAFLLFDPEGKEVTKAARLSVNELITIARDVGADGLDLGKSSKIDDDYASQILLAGLELHVWTVNTLEDALRYAELGFSTLTTDRPADLCREIEEHFQNS